MAQGLAAQQGMANPYLLQAAAAGQAISPNGLNPAALAALANAVVGNPTWAATAAQLLGGGIPPAGPLFHGGNAAAQQQVQFFCMTEAFSALLVVCSTV